MRNKTLRRRRGVARRVRSISAVVRGVLSSDAGSLLGALCSTLAAIDSTDDDGGDSDGDEGAASGLGGGRSSRLVPRLVLPASRLTWDTEATEVAVARAEGALFANEERWAPCSGSLGESVSASASIGEEEAAAAPAGAAAAAPAAAAAAAAAPLPSTMDFSGCTAELLRALAATPRARPASIEEGGAAAAAAPSASSSAVAAAAPAVTAVAVPEVVCDTPKASLPNTPAALNVVAMTPRD